MLRRGFISGGIVIAFIALLPVTSAQDTSASGSIVRGSNVLCAGHCSVPIFMYHYIRDKTAPRDSLGRKLSVSQKNFSKQLDALIAQGYSTVRFSDIASGKPLPTHPVVLTFDDGYEDAFIAALPELQKRKMTAVFYIITDFVGKPGYLSVSELKTLRDAGMELGAHTVDHPDLSRLPAGRQREEIGLSAAYIRERAGAPVTSFAYPSGKYNALTTAIMREQGIPFAVTTHHGVATERSKPLLLPRIRMTNTTNMTSLLANLRITSH